MLRNKDSQSYLKYTACINIIMKNSDESHPLMIKDIQNLLYDLNYDFTIDYRIIKNYVQAYNDYHNDTLIQSYKKSRNLYFYYVHPSLDMMEAKAIVDLVYSSDFFTLQTKENYRKRIQEMFSIYYHAYYHKNLNLHIVKNENSDVFYKELEVIAKAIHDAKKIRFTYQKPSINSKIKEAKRTELAPIDTVFSNNEYYLLCQGVKNSQDCLLYRLDYIKDVEIVEESKVCFSPMELNAFTIKMKNMTYMYGDGPLEYIDLDFDQAIYANIIDKFGKKIRPQHIQDNIYRVHVKSIINNTFYSWIIGFGGKIHISGNEQQVLKFKKFLTDNFLSEEQAHLVKVK